MSTYDWPAYKSDKAFWPKSVELLQFHNNREAVSSLSGDIQTTSVPGARWGWVLNFDEQSWDERGRLLGFLTRLSGKQHRVRLFAPHQPKPLSLNSGGTINTAGVTASASAAQFATSLALTGVRGSNLLLAGRSMTNGVWTKDGVTLTENNNLDPEGTVTSDKLAESSANSPHRVFQSVTVPSAAGVYTASANFSMNGRDWAYLIAREQTGSTDMAAWFNLTTGVVGTVTTGANWSGVSASILGASGAGHTRVRLTGTKTNAATGLTWIAGVGLSDGNQSFAGNVLNSFNVWGAMLEPAAAAGSYALPVLQAGDFFRVADQQLCMAVTRAVADDLGAMTVEFRHPLRAAVSSGAAVALDSPTGLYILETSEFGAGFDTGLRAPPMSIQFREVFA